jgi:predicted metal-dependent phosphoesterase TrpH
MPNRLIENRKLKLMSTAKALDFRQNLSNHKIDLHTHTCASDGALTPSELIERAVNFQLDVLAITDHDTVDGLEQAKAYLNQKNYPLTLLPGIEISSAWHNFDIHIVGLNIDTKHPKLVELISEQQQARYQRALEMGEKLAKANMPDVYDYAKRQARGEAITRSHFAKAMFDLGYVSDLQKAFDKYIGKGKRAFVKPKWCSIERAIATIQAAGGVAVLAHPIRYDLSGKWRRKLVEEFKNFGGHGLEIVLPQMNPQQRELMLNYCLEYDLYASLGSDFHAPSRWRELGKNLTLPENCRPVWQLFNA